MKNTLLKCNSLAWQYLTHVTSCNIACIKTLAEGFCFPALRGLTQFELNCTSYTGVSGCLSPWKVSTPFALAVLMCWARSALPMSAWHVTALCMSGSEHTQFHRSLALQARSCLVERLPVACLDMPGCVITCGVGVCLHGKTSSGCSSVPWGKPVACDTTGSNSAHCFHIMLAQWQGCLAKTDGEACVGPWVLNVWIVLSLGDKEVSTRWKTSDPGMLAPWYNETGQVSRWSMMNSGHSHFQPYLTLKTRFSLFWSERAISVNSSDWVCILQDLNLAHSALKWEGKLKPSLPLRLGFFYGVGIGCKSGPHLGTYIKWSGGAY